MSAVTIRRALLSVSDKTYLEDLARAFQGMGIEMVATGGTAEKLKRAGVQYRPIETFTGNPEAFDGRMKTISFKLESALLFDRSNSHHVAEAEKLEIEPIDCVVCNFYPFEQALSRNAAENDLIHEVDIGGPTMVRAAAKNFKSVLVLTDPSDYAEVLNEMRHLGGAVSLELRRKMMVKAFERVMRYDQAIFEGFARKSLRYGENPHQVGYFVPDTQAAGVQWELIEGSGVELSYNNILDAQAAYGVVRDAMKLAPPSHGVVGIIKHNNPCGLATGPTIVQAFERAWAGDPVSSFGGVIALSSQLTIECARLFEEKFVEVLLAPGFEDGALQELQRKKKKLRILKINNFEDLTTPEHFQRTRIEGGTLVQQPDLGVHEELKVVTKTKFPDELAPAARFAIAAAKWVKSNAITIVRVLPDGAFQLVGMGSGQPNRVDALRRLAFPKARDVLTQANVNVDLELSRCVMASDAFFPFSDTIEEAHRAGLRYIVQPGGSIRDKEIIEACDRLSVAMALTGKRHFRH